MAKPTDYYVGDFLTKVGAGLLAGGTVAVNVTNVIPVIPPIAVIVSFVLLGIEYKMMRDNE